MIIKDRYLSTFYWQISKLHDDNRALDRLTKSKEIALLEAERTVEISLAKASMVDDLQNKNQDLIKQIEICQVNCILLHLVHVDKSDFPIISREVTRPTDKLCIFLGGKQDIRQIAQAKDCRGRKIKPNCKRVRGSCSCWWGCC